MSVWSELKVTWAATRLLALAGDPTGAQLETVFDVLGDLTPEERALAGQRAIVLGADPSAVQALLALVEGETIEVSSKAPRRWWPLVLGAVGGLATGALVASKVR